MRKVVFVTFADSRYLASLNRIKKETDVFGFTERHFFSEKDFLHDFFKGFCPRIYRRRYGHWNWKPDIVERALRIGPMFNDLKSYFDKLVELFAHQWRPVTTAVWA